MAVIEMLFPMIGQTLPRKHGYGLYASLSGVLPQLHDPSCPWQIGPVVGEAFGRGVLRLDPYHSRLRLRLPADEIPHALPLAGKGLDVAGHRVRLGIPQVRALEPATCLLAKLVAIKVHGVPYPTPEQFLGAVRRKLDRRGIGGELTIPPTRFGPHAGEPRRDVLRIKGTCIVGYAVMIRNLTPTESLDLQAKTISGRSRMGGGFFVPVREEADTP